MTQFQLTDAEVIEACLVFAQARHGLRVQELRYETKTQSSPGLPIRIVATVDPEGRFLPAAEVIRKFEQLYHPNAYVRR